MSGGAAVWALALADQLLAPRTLTACTCSVYQRPGTMNCDRLVGSAIGRLATLAAPLEAAWHPSIAEPGVAASLHRLSEWAITGSPLLGPPTQPKSRETFEKLVPARAVGASGALLPVTK